jgi:hypothetical protein
MTLRMVRMLMRSTGANEKMYFRRINWNYFCFVCNYSRLLCSDSFVCFLLCLFLEIENANVLPSLQLNLYKLMRGGYNYQLLESNFLNAWPPQAPAGVGCDHLSWYRG